MCRSHPLVPRGFPPPLFPVSSLLVVCLSPAPAPYRACVARAQRPFRCGRERL